MMPTAVLRDPAGLPDAEAVRPGHGRRRPAQTDRAPAISRMRERTDWSEYGAAPLLGVEGGCFVGHGRSTAKAIHNAIRRAEEFCRADLHHAIRDKIAELHHREQSLLVADGEDIVLWGTDSIWYGSPQQQIHAFRAFQITPEFQDRFGYPALTDALKSKILGLNAATLYGIDPGVVSCRPGVAERSASRRRLADSGVDRLHGPTTAAAANRTFRADHPWFG